MSDKDELVKGIGGLLLLGFLGFGIYKKNYGSGEFSIAPGQTITREFVGSVGNLVPNNQGKLITGFDPTKIDSPDFVRVKVSDAWSGGKFINGNWSGRSGFTYTLVADSAAEPGSYTITFVFPADERSLRFSVK